MRKTSQDGGDSTSITSGADNEFKKSILKPKKTSLKRKAPNYSHDSDDTVIEPLLHKDKEKTIITSAKFFTKAKTDTVNDKESDKTKLLNDNKPKTTSTEFCGTTESLLSIKEYEVTKSTTTVTAPIHNYMNTNVFHSHDHSKSNVVTTRSKILVEIDGSKPSGYNPSPLIFTTAKIHTDGKSKHMEPLQVTPVPILSTIEVSMSKGGSITSNEKKISNGASVLNTVYSPSISYTKEEKGTINSANIIPTSSFSKDSINNIVTTATGNSKLSNNTLVQNQRSMENNLPSSSKAVLTSNNKEIQVITKDIQKQQSLPTVTQAQLKNNNFDNVKNNVSVMTTKSLSGTLDIPMTQAKATPAVTGSVDQCSVGNTRGLATAIKSPKPPSENSHTSSKILNNSNKQLQRQKTTSEDSKDVETNLKCNAENFKDSCAKTPSAAISLSQPIIPDSNISKDSDKLIKTSANNAEAITKSSLNTTVSSMSKVSSTSLTTTPATGITFTTQTAVSSKPSTPTTSWIGKSASSKVTTPLNKTGSLATDALTTSKSPVNSTFASIPVTKSPVVPSKSVLVTMSPIVSTASKTASLNSASKNALSTKTLPVVTLPLITTTTKASTVSVAKPIETKTPSTTILTKTTPMSPVTSTTASTTKPLTQLTSSQSTTTTKTTAFTTGKTAVTKAPSITLSTKTVPASSIASNVTSATKKKSEETPPHAVITTKQTIGLGTKTPAVASGTKLSGDSPRTGVSTVSAVKSPEVNLHNTSVTTKPTLSSSVTEPVVIKAPSARTSNKTILGKSTSNAATSLAKTNQSQDITSPRVAVSTKNPSSTSTEKTTVTKTPTTTSATKASSISSFSSTATPASVKLSSPENTTAQKAFITKESVPSAGKSVILKIPTVTTSISTTTLTSAITATGSAITTKPTSIINTTLNSCQTQDIEKSSVPSFTSALQSSSKTTDSIKKGESKSSDNNKDGKISKA